MSELEKLLRKLQQGGGRAIDDFTRGALEIAKQRGEVLLRGAAPDLLARYERTTLDMLNLAARELSSGQHSAPEWRHIKAQQSLQNFAGAAIAFAQAALFIAEIAQLALGAFTGAAGFAARALLETLDQVLLKP